MAVSVDTVYQRVLSILNKEQRGYITPQEFNLFANQAQASIFEQYFYDINQFGRLHGNDTEYSDMLNILNEKIGIFENTTSLTYVTDHFELPSNLYRIGTIIYNNIEAERVNNNEILYINLSPLTRPTDSRPIYTYKNDEINVFGANELTSGISCNYIRRPASANWAYQMVFGEALYDATNSVDFELHPSDETTLVLKILELSGLAIMDPALYQIAAQEEAKEIQQEKS
jgi:hypothetical protein